MEKHAPFAERKQHFTRHVIQQNDKLKEIWPRAPVNVQLVRFHEHQQL